MRGDSASRADPQAGALRLRALPTVAQAYVAIVIAAGAVAVATLFPLHIDRPILFIALLAIGCVLSTWKVNLPAAFGSGSTLSVSYAADLMALLLFGAGPATLIALGGVWTQCTVKTKRRYPLYRTVYSVAAEGLTMRATAAAYVALGGLPQPVTLVAGARAVVGAIVVYFLVNTLLVAGAMALSTRQSVFAVWQDNFLWSAPSFMVSGSAGAFAAVLVARGDLWTAILLVAPIYLTYRTYSVFHESMRTLAQVRTGERALASEKERLAVVLDSIGDGVIAVDAGSRVTLLNRAAEAMTGWAAGAAVGRPATEVYRTLDFDTHQPLAQTAAASLDLDLPRTTRRVMLAARDDSKRPIEEVTAPLADAEGGATGIVIAFRDITDTIQVQAEQERASRLSSLGVLAGGIAHDFNNVLAAVMGNVSFVRTTLADDADADDSLQQAEQACVRARQLTHQLLTFARGGAPLKKPLRLAPLIQESARLALSGTNVRCIADVGPSLWLVDADEGQLVQVFNNLLLNARQAMTGGGAIDVRAENVAEPEARWEHGVLVKPGPYVHVAIADKGAGISNHVLHRIFEPYFTTKTTGSGLGLATAYSIVNNHGGYLTVDSEVGRGTTVHVRLPAVFSANLDDEPDVDGATRAGTGRVLLLDDEEPVRIVARKMLAALDYDCEAVSTGDEAIARYRAARSQGNPFDLVILDLTIPGGLGGNDVVRELRTFDPDVKAIVASGYAHEGIMARFRDHGFCAMLTKPFTMDELRAALEQVCSIRPEKKRYQSTRR
jgi:PAS domain S-box-containing protein